MSEEFERAQQRPAAETVAVAVLLLGAAAALAYLFWRRRPREDDGGAGTPPDEAVCLVDVAKDARITLDAHGNVRGFERSIPIRIRPGDTRRHGVKWIVNNRHGAAAREVHLGNMRAGSKTGPAKEIFENGSDRALVGARREQYFYSCLLPDVPEGKYCYDILIDGHVKIDPEIAIIRR